MCRKEQAIRMVAPRYLDSAAHLSSDPASVGELQAWIIAKTTNNWYMRGSRRRLKNREFRASLSVVTTWVLSRLTEASVGIVLEAR